ncbi:hypothetical protein TWF106_008841 [Orbilia oligospora]|uniref:NECAP PHear domain-containing protein n=1 Tax=Orbilia oligospora TaxID=2813651 RepID=A0A6G1LUI0_ORBOL|nr:hypothetical protein TWF788_010553 [Orbilia oligospora]KAF3208989.1 hypothetical protein TWF679_007511 [Orbilia oligospora]KAF3214996.1 hypothetical protein TWF106_008841 [Orbilia oligospora]KAF3232229.1 hypothetical protein TWF191_000008 [Orbilia oligospora]KAF3234897.1 hypothetical protein TWF192_001157 [Orbilia oligospora]
MADEKIENVLFLGRVHCYAVPPLTANKGYKAAEWRIEDPKSIIFTARIRVIETSDIDGGNVKTNIKLEDPESGELFANGPYEGPYCVSPVTDSSRFFAVRVVDGARRAYLGIGFEERSDAFDFNVCLQEVRRHNNLEDQHGGPANNLATGKTSYGTGRNAAALGQPAKPSSVTAAVLHAPPKDYSLKDGETINITIGNKGRRRPPTSPTPASDSTNGFPLPFLPPPPTADAVKKKRQSMTEIEMAAESAFVGIPAPPTSTRITGFDDEFGDFV